MSIIASFGSWESPVGAADTVAEIVRFSDLQYDNGSLYWLESRPSEGGRAALVRRTARGTIEEVLPDTVNVRTMAHEYGGAAYRVESGDVVYSEFTDQRLYRVTPDGSATPLTSEPSRRQSVRFADAIRLPDGSLIAVRETHPAEGEAINELVSVGSAGDAEVIASGCDFYSTPRLSPDGTRLAWVEWDHPNMPWDGTRLVVAKVANPDNRTVIAGGDDESIVQPEWAPDGTLVFASDRTGWWNLYRYDSAEMAPILQMEAEFAGPAWVFGESWYGFLSDGRIATSFCDNGQNGFGIIDADGVLEQIELGFSDSGYHIITDGDQRVWFVGARPDELSAVVEFNAASGAVSPVQSNPSIVDAGYVTEPRVISFPTTGADVAHAVYYPPANPQFEGPAGELPPLIVHIHGGPTSHVSPVFKPETVFWTSRGFGVVDVNYRGSTGFGRAYREKLEGEWGVVDVDDAVAAAEYLASIGEVDGDRLAISGGSAGGYTTLAALTFRDSFAAGASYFGIADIEMLMGDSHKFESRYETRLIGTDPVVWRERSPIHSVDQISVPVALFQGLEDKVVPPNQAVVIAEALAERGIPYVHIEYEGEGHGFRQAANVIRSLETELAFYGYVFGFTPPGDVSDVDLGPGILDGKTDG